MTKHWWRFLPGPLKISTTTLITSVRTSSNSMSRRLSKVVVPPLEEHSATLIFLHGSGDCGEGMKERLDELAPYGQKRFQFPHIKIIYPTAPIRRYTLMYGMSSRVWFDRREMELDGWEDEACINEVCESLDQLISEEVLQCNIQPHRILIGGLSMGGAMSLQYGYGWRGSTHPFPQYSAGIFVLSSFLHKNSKVYRTLKQESGTNRHYPVLYQSHGVLDDLVALDWAQKTNSNLSQMGVQCVSADSASSRSCSQAAVAVNNGSSCSKNSITAVCSSSNGASNVAAANHSSTHYICDSKDQAINNSSSAVYIKGLHIYPDLGHTIHVEELQHLTDWILTVLPRN